MRIPLTGLPGFTSEALGDPGKPGVVTQARIRKGEVVVGDIVYCQRRLPAGGSLYGWRPATMRSNASLTSKADAVRRLPGYRKATR